MLVLATLTVMEVEIREVSMATPRTAGKPRVRQMVMGMSIFASLVRGGREGIVVIVGG
jgi:hypothetical protein